MIRLVVVALVITATNVDALCQEQSEIICSVPSTFGELGSISGSPNAREVVYICHVETDMWTPFHLFVNGKEIARVNILAPTAVYWSTDSTAFGWWKKIESGWVPVVTSVQGDELYVGTVSYKSLAIGKTGFTNVSSRMEVGPTVIDYHCDEEGIQYLGEKPTVEEVAGIHLALENKGERAAWFARHRSPEGVTSWEVFDGKEHKGSYENVWLPSLRLNVKEPRLAYVVRRGDKEAFVVVGEKQWGPYVGYSRIYLSQDGKRFGWFAVPAGSEKWFLFVDGEKTAGPFDEGVCCEFLPKGDVAYVARHTEACVAVTPKGHRRIASDNYVAGPCFSADGDHIAFATAQSSYPWSSAVIVDDEKVFGSFAAITNRYSDHIELKKYGVLSLAWSTSTDSVATLTAMVVDGGKIRRLEKTFGRKSGLASPREMSIITSAEGSARSADGAPADVDLGRFAVIGIFRVSSLWAGDDLQHYRIVDASADGKTLCYAMAVGKALKEDLGQYLGRKVGLVGDIMPHPNPQLSTALVKFSQIVTLD